jgi:DNA-binding HxlR family transcriptional regulator
MGMSSAPEPLQDAFELLGRRQALRVVWELSEGPLGFRELQRASAISSSVLSQRLRDLSDGNIVESKANLWRLTRQGTSLVDALGDLLPWSKRWARSRPK